MNKKPVPPVKKPVKGTPPPFKKGAKPFPPKKK